MHRVPTSTSKAMNASKAQDPAVRPSPADLPPHLAKVAAQLRQGKSNKEAAKALGLSCSSVGTYAKQLNRHFNVTSRAELVRTLVESEFEHSNTGRPPSPAATSRTEVRVDVLRANQIVADGMTAGQFTAVEVKGEGGMRLTPIRGRKPVVAGLAAFVALIGGGAFLIDRAPDEPPAAQLPPEPDVVDFLDRPVTVQTVANEEPSYIGFVNPGQLLRVVSFGGPVVLNVNREEFEVDGELLFEVGHGGRTTVASIRGEVETSIEFLPARMHPNYDPERHFPHPHAVR
jgi:hypothetical protein